MKYRKGLKIALVAVMMATVVMPSTKAYAIVGYANPSTQIEQFAQIMLMEQDLEAMLQAIEALNIGGELMKIFEQMFEIQGIVQDVMEYEVPEEYVQEYELIDPIKAKALTRARAKYLKEIDAEIAGYENEIALDPDQFATLTSAAGIISEPRSGIIAQQAQFVSEQSDAELKRREMAVNILKAKRQEIREQVATAQKISMEALARCIRETMPEDGCNQLMEE